MLIVKIIGVYLVLSVLVVAFYCRLMRRDPCRNCIADRSRSCSKCPNGGQQ